jgi:hypothetical protein
MDNRSLGVAAANDSSISSVRDTAAATTGNNPHTTSTGPSSGSIPAPTIPYPSFQHVPASMMDVDNNTVAEDRSRRATSVLSMDDIEAAQALEGLRTGIAFSAPPFSLLESNRGNCISMLICSNSRIRSTSSQHLTADLRSRK